MVNKGLRARSRRRLTGSLAVRLGPMVRVDPFILAAIVIVVVLALIVVVLAGWFDD